MIRPLERKDIAQCATIVSANYTKMVAMNCLIEMDMGLSDLPWRPHFLVLELDGEIQALGAYAPSWMDWNVWALTWINVHPLLQRRGFGKTIVNACLMEMRAICDTAILMTGKPDFYSKNWGFKEIARLPSEQGDVMMVKALKFGSEE